MFDKDVNQARVPLNVTNSIEPAPFYQRAAVNSRTGGIPLSQNANIRELMKEKYYAKLTFNYGIVLVVSLFYLMTISLLFCWEP